MIIYSQIIDVYKESLMGAFRSFDSVIVPSMFVLYMILICANYVRSETEEYNSCQAPVVSVDVNVHYFCDKDNNLRASFSCNANFKIQTITQVKCVKGNWSSGNRSSGNRSSGNWSSGNWSSGNGSSGNWSSGNRSSGNRSSGNRSSGNRSSGNRSSGNRSSENGSSGNRSSGNGGSRNRSSGNWSRGIRPTCTVFLSVNSTKENFPNNNSNENSTSNELPNDSSTDDVVNGGRIHLQLTKRSLLGCGRKLVPPDNGSIHYYCDSQRVLKAHFKCSNGYAISDTTPKACRNGNWGSTHPKCIRFDGGQKNKSLALVTIMTPIHTMPPTRGTALSISTSSPEISKQETFTSVNITTKPDATTTLLKTLLTQSRVATDNSRNEGISNYKVTSGHSTKTESASKPTAIDVGTITTTENTTIEGTFGALYTTPLSPLVNTEFQTSVTSTSVPNVSSLSTDIALSFTNSSDFQTKNKPLVFLEESTSLITTAVPLISPTIATSGETILQSTETVSTNTTVPSSIKPSLTGNKRMIDTYAGTVAVASLGAASGSMVIGSAAYLILRKFACNKVSPTPADGDMA